MHFDDFVESIADSDLEDGELQKMLTSPLSVKKVSEKPDAMTVQEGEVSAQYTQVDQKESLRSHLSECHKALGKPNALFSSEQGNLIRSSVFRIANPSNLRGSLLEGNKDHFLHQARSDLAKQELHVESLTKCIGELQRQTEEQTLASQDAQYGFVESRREQVRLQEEMSMKEQVLRNTQIRNMHEMGEMKRAQQQRIDEVSVQKIKRRSRDNSAAHFPIAANARADEFYEWFWRFSTCGIELQWKVVSRFQSTCNDSEFSCFAQPRQKIAAWYMESIWITGKRFWKSNFYV